MTINVVGRVFESTTGADHLTGSTWNDMFHMTADNWVTDFVDGGAGNDTIDYSGSQVGVDITLTDAANWRVPSGGTVTADFVTSTYNQLTGTTISYHHEQTVAELTNIENATGSSHNDVLIGNSADNVLDGGAGNDVINGGAGNDTIVGGFGTDTLTGGAGGDTFVFKGTEITVPLWGGAQMTMEVIDTSASVATADVITDFQRGADHIDLSGIDSNIQVGGHQAFNFIGTAQFTGQAGELRDSVDGTNTVVEGDLNGDGHADFSIVLQDLGHTHLALSDFIL